MPACSTHTRPKSRKHLTEAELRRLVITGKELWRHKRMKRPGPCCCPGREGRTAEDDDQEVAQGLVASGHGHLVPLLAASSAQGTIERGALSISEQVGRVCKVINIHGKLDRTSSACHVYVNTLSPFSLASTLLDLTDGEQVIQTRKQYYQLIEKPE